MEEKDYSRRTAAARLAVSEQTVDRLIRAGLLGAFKIGRRVVIPAGAMDRFVASRLAAPAGAVDRQKD